MDACFLCSKAAVLCGMIKGVPYPLADIALNVVKSMALLSSCLIICYKFTAVFFFCYPEGGDGRLLQNIFNFTSWCDVIFQETTVIMTGFCNIAYIRL